MLCLHFVLVGRSVAKLKWNKFEGNHIGYCYWMCLASLSSVGADGIAKNVGAYIPILVPALLCNVFAELSRTDAKFSLPTDAAEFAGGEFTAGTKRF